MDTVLVIIVMFIGYGIAIFFIIRALLVGLSLKKGEVPYVPSSKVDMIEAIDALDLVKGDNLIDIGSGDGKVLFYIARKYPDIICVGIERSKLLVLWSNFVTKLLNYKNLRFELADALKYDYSLFNKVYLYLTKELIVPLMPELIPQLKVNSKVVSVRFGFLGLLEAIEVEKVGEKGTQLYTK